MPPSGRMWIAAAAGRSTGRSFSPTKAGTGQDRAGFARPPQAAKRVTRCSVVRPDVRQKANWAREVGLWTPTALEGGHRDSTAQRRQYRRPFARHSVIVQLTRAPTATWGPESASVGLFRGHGRRRAPSSRQDLPPSLETTLLELPTDPSRPRRPPLLIRRADRQRAPDPTTSRNLPGDSGSFHLLGSYDKKPAGRALMQALEETHLTPIDRGFYPAAPSTRGRPSAIRPGAGPKIDRRRGTSRPRAAKSPAFRSSSDEEARRFRSELAEDNGLAQAHGSSRYQAPSRRAGSVRSSRGHRTTPFVAHDLHPGAARRPLTSRPTGNVFGP